MKILVIFTGGTIGSTVTGDWIVTDESTKYTLLEHFKTEDHETEFDVRTPYTLLSENLSAKALNLLQTEIEQGLHGGYDGIIVTHGTDTLQYSAAAVEYAFAGCKIPIVFVSSNYPLEDKRANGHFNFAAAVAFIKEQIGGVFVAYRNNGETVTHIHLASHILQYNECTSKLYSIDEMPYAVYDGKAFQFTAVEHAEIYNPLGIVSYTASSGILVIDSHPGDSYTYTLNGIKAVLLKPYHSATLDTGNPKLHAFCQKARELEIPVFVVNVAPGISYESTKHFDDLHIIPLPYSTWIAAYMKLWAGISLGEAVTDFSSNPIANEIAKVHV